MEASPCFLTCKSFIKTSSATSPFFHKKRPGQVFPGRAASSPSVIYCNLRSDQDDGGEALIKSDWRSFRARLVAGEQAITSLDRGLTPLPPPAVALGDKWAHLIHEPERGCLLLATDKLDGVHIFERTVILLLSVGPLGPTGVILNRPSLMSIKETPSVNLDVAGVFSDRPLFFGGPLEEGLFLVGPRGGRNDDDGTDRSGVFEEVMQGVYYGTKESVGCAAEMVKRDVVGVKDVRFFDGYCGWEREQLAEEIRAGFWRVVACSPTVVGEAGAGRSVGLWEEVMGLVGESKVMD
ncbi:UPF0301 protein TC_0483-like [Zingiber officinale]|uniref:Uncharacterized protein n=1 Tax=Zingiber officinale TaxID=94328 RepID=A0A8J5GPK9_ZINOF|nr:UPF0301 protein TC_0483-like [Zingiber officinale]KAG6507663.1 hypothetical protein ZIOFF_033014 [Zingiber officinale]